MKAGKLFKQKPGIYLSSFLDIRYHINCSLLKTKRRCDSEHVRQLVESKNIRWYEIRRLTSSRS